MSSSPPPQQQQQRLAEIHKSKMDELLVEVCGENGANYKVNIDESTAGGSAPAGAKCPAGRVRAECGPGSVVRAGDRDFSATGLAGWSAQKERKKKADDGEKKKKSWNYSFFFCEKVCV